MSFSVGFFFSGSTDTDISKSFTGNYVVLIGIASYDSLILVKQEYEGRLKIVKIDHDANPQLIEEYKVYGLPALILFKNGQEVPGSRREGAITKDKFKEYLEPLLETTTVT